VTDRYIRITDRSAVFYVKRAVKDGSFSADFPVEDFEVGQIVHVKGGLLDPETSDLEFYYHSSLLLLWEDEFVFVSPLEALAKVGEL